MPKLTLPAAGGAMPVVSPERPSRRKLRAGGDLFRDPSASILGKRGGRLKVKLTTLPFVRGRREGRQCFWSVKPTGDYLTDYQQGQEWAHLVLPFLNYNVGAPFLSWIVEDMVAAGEKNGLVLGFIREIGEQLGRVRVGLAIALATAGPKMPVEQLKQFGGFAHA